MPAPNYLPVKLYVVDPKQNYKTIRELQYNFGNSRPRAKMIATINWALSQGYAVEIERSS